MLVPFLSFWLTKLGGDGIMHLAGNIVGGVQSVSGAVGSEVLPTIKALIITVAAISNTAIQTPIK